MVTFHEQGDEANAAVAGAARLRRVAGFSAESLTLALVPSASEPAYTTVRLSPETVVTGPAGQALVLSVLSRASLVALVVEMQADGCVLATKIGVRSFVRKVRRVPGGTA